MIPLYDENPHQHTPWVTWGLIATNVIVFLFELHLQGAGLDRFFHAYGLVPRAMVPHLKALSTGHSTSLASLAPLLTAMFLHAGWLHIGGNMLFLYIFGDNVEDRLGHAGYALFYVAAGVVSALCQTFASSTSPLPELGASGAIGGVLGAYVMLYPEARVRTLAFLGFFVTLLRVPAWIFLGVWFLLQAVQGVWALNAASSASAGGVAWWAHVGGFLTGVAVGMALRAVSPSRKPSDRGYSNRR